MEQPTPKQFDLTVVLACGHDADSILASLKSIADFSDLREDLTLELVFAASGVELAKAIAKDLVGAEVRVVPNVIDSAALAMTKAAATARGSNIITLQSGQPIDPRFKDGTRPLPRRHFAGFPPNTPPERTEVTVYGNPLIHPGTVAEGPTHFGAGLRNIRPAHFGAFTYSYAPITEGVASIGRYCSIANRAVFAEPEHPTNWLSTSPATYEPRAAFHTYLNQTGSSFDGQSYSVEEDAYRPVHIGNDVWVGAGAYIKGGVTLGDGCIIGSEAVVTKDVPPYAVVVGNPGRIIRYRFEPEQIEKLLELQWWNYSFIDLKGVDVFNIDIALDELLRRREAGELTPYVGYTFPMKELLSLP